MPGFGGFPKEALTFFKGLEKNNNKDWFDPRKQTFESTVKAPMIQLVDALNAHMAVAAPHFVTDPKKAIYRIYRDTRFSKDKTPYKTHIAAVFNHRLLDKHSSAGFYFAVSHKSVDFGGGVYMPEAEQMLTLRTLFAERYAEFRKLAAAKPVRALIGDLQGEKLTRPPKGFPAGHAADELLRAKQWYWYVEMPSAIATTPKLLPELKKRFDALAPLMEFMNAPLLAKRKKEAARSKFQFEG